ncbi:uncharacterized protein LOC143298548 [Babylonia areolata]|uniref:uncharacterized protein LOC143298548 n=1 Tax=Babylonia areolata TaxID=304850 RepID=UPI003FD06BAF
MIIDFIPFIYTAVKKMRILRSVAAVCIFSLLSTFLFICCWPFAKVWSKLTSNIYIVYLSHITAILTYFHLLQTKQQWFADDICLGYHNFCVVLLTLEFIGNAYSAQINQVALSTRRYVDRFGWTRCFLFLLTVSSSGYLLVSIADKAENLVRDFSKGEILRRFEDNIHRIEEDRKFFQTSTVHPVTKGKHDPKIFHKLFRYPMEDVRMKCVHRMPWLSAGSPFQQQIVWQRNGVPVTPSDRHSIKVAFREVPEYNSLLDSKLREYGISVYEINSTLTIHLLKTSEFGSYTCHVAKFVQNTVRDYIRFMDKLNKVGTSRRESTEEAEPAKPPSPTCSNAVQPRIQWTDVYTWVEEFRLIRLTRRQEPIRVAPGAILSFTTSYWHLGWKEDIAVDYSVNQQSFYDLCPGTFHGCSKLLLLYWFLGNDIGWRFGGPPLHLFDVWNQPAERFHLLHCLCERSYGHHTIRYMRRYYNRTTNRHELIEIQHPHKLLVIPRDQQMLDLFVNSSAPPPVTTPQCCAEIGSDGEDLCSSFLINEMAAFATDFFRWKELLMIVLLCFVVLYVACKVKLFFSYTGRFIRCLTLEGSMGFLFTATLTSAIQAGPESEQPRTDTSYDVFVSYSDAEPDSSIVNGLVLRLELKGLKVFARDRDGHPGMSELQTISNALEKSRRFLIFLSQAYFGDRFRNDFEAAMIFETLCDRSPQPDEILLIKLNRCEVPLWLKQFPVHDWTASGVKDSDRLHQLLKWLEPAEHKAMFRSALDLLMSVSPVAVVSAALLVISNFSYMI